MSKIKAWLAASAAAIIGILSVMFMSQRNKTQEARHEEQQAKRSLSQKQKQQEKTKDVAQAQSRARQDNSEHAKGKRSQSKAERRSGKFGTAGRVR